MKKTLFILTAAVLLVGCTEEWEANKLVKRQQLHQAWMKATGITNLTLAEWEILRNSELLPGQMKSPDNSGDLAVGIAIGSTMNSGGRR